MDELKRHDIEFEKDKSYDMDTLRNVVGWRLMKGGGREEEAKEAYKLFDKREKGNIGTHDVRSVVNQYINFSVSDAEIKEFIDLADSSKNNRSQISQNDFISFYNYDGGDS